MHRNSIYTNLTPKERLEEVTKLLSKAVLSRIRNSKNKLNHEHKASNQQEINMNKIRKNQNCARDSIYEGRFMTIKKSTEFLKI